MMKFSSIFMIFLTTFNNSHAGVNLRLSDIDMHPHREASETKSTGKSGIKNNIELNPEYWLENAKNLVSEKLKAIPNTNKAKNVIFFLGDGMGHTTVAATRVAMGGEELKLSFENFPHTSSSKTYCLDRTVPDSACTATAFFRGIKNNNGILGLNGFARRSNCNDSKDTRLYTNSIAKWAQDAGMATGVVTTTRITHATPAGLYANVADRDWENNAVLASKACDHNEIDDIAEQLVRGETGMKFKVIFGGGSMNFVNSTVIEHGRNGARTDGKNLINEWKEMKISRKFIRTRSELMNLNIEKDDEIFGMFSSDDIPYHKEVIEKNLVDIPSLAEMTSKAIEVLKNNDKGFFLMVEGGRIDHANHDNFARMAIDETIEFDKAIQTAINSVNLNETLIVVTADHSHVLSYAGYAPRNHDIFGIQGQADDNMSYYTLSYANGPGFNNHFNNGHRIDPSSLNTSPSDFRFPATVPLTSETHAGEDVGIWANGASSYLFQGVLEQNMIAHIMAYALCIGDGLKACDK